MTFEKLTELSRLIRYWILTSTNQAGSGHPTSSLSAVELMTSLMFDGRFRYFPDQPEYPNNDRLIFSKGHASPLFYALWAAADQISEDDMMTYRSFQSTLEGHPTSRFPMTEAATGSLGQGLSIGVGLAMNGKFLDRLPYRTFVLLGDSEMAEGSQWEAIQLAAHYELNNLVGIIDVNGLGQRGETMYGHDLAAYQRRIEAFGWNTRIVEDGHSFEQLRTAYEEIDSIENERPTMILARTNKGQGVSFLEGENGWHGKPLDDGKLQEAIDGLGEVDHSVRGTFAAPAEIEPNVASPEPVEDLHYEQGEEVATRNGFGNALKRLAPKYPELVTLDGEVCNSTRTQFLRDSAPEHFFEMYIAEQNMVGAGLGLSLCHKKTFVSSFAAFLTRAFDQIRMAPHSEANLKFAGSHAGVSIGEDGPSQMGLEDLAMFRSVLGSVVLYPCDAVSTERLVELMMEHEGISYLRTTRGKTPVIYDADTPFEIGGSHTLRESDNDDATIVAAGITLHEALKAHEQLKQDGISARVIDLYSIKPLDETTLKQAAESTRSMVVVEDHYEAGGIGEAVRGAVMETGVRFTSLAVRKRPRSGPEEKLLADQNISADAITQAVQNLVKKHAAV